MSGIPVCVVAGDESALYEITGPVGSPEYFEGLRGLREMWAGKPGEPAPIVVELHKTITRQLDDCLTIVRRLEVGEVRCNG